MQEFDFYDLTSDASIEPVPVPTEAITITPDSFTTVEYHSSGDMMFMDVVFSVICTDEETGQQKSYKLVKRLGFDKFKLAHEAKQLEPVIIESKGKSVFANPQMEKLYETEKAVITAKKIAKLPIDYGKNLFEVVIQDQSGSTTVCHIQARNEGHALMKFVDDVIPNQFPGSSILKISKF